MNGIKEYLLCVIGTVIIGTLAELIVSSLKKRNSGIEKTVHLCTSLCIMAVITAPFLSTLKGCEEFEIDKGYTRASDAEYELYIIEKEATDKTSEYIFQKTGIKPTSIRIDIIAGEDMIPEIVKAEIYLKKEYVEMERDIKKAGYECLGKEVNVMYDS